MRKTFALAILAAGLLVAPALADIACHHMKQTTTASTTLVPPSGQTASTLNQPTVSGN